MVKKIKPYNMKQLGLKMKGKPVVQLSFKGKFTKKDIVDYVQKRSNKFFKDGKQGSIMTSVRWNPGKKGWRSAKDTAFGEHVDWYDGSDSDVIQEEPDTFKEFRVYILK